ncbi:MAG: carboxymuconolactone decarboxylase family protein [Pseudomonadota bacterium]
MARITTPSLDELPAAQQEAVSQAEALMGFVANDALIMSQNPALTDAFARLVAAIYAPGEVAAGLKRLIGLMVSSAAGCQYCMGHTAHTSAMHGISAEKLADVWVFEDSQYYDAAEKAALRVAMHAGQQPNAVTDSMFEALAVHFSEAAQLEIVAVISLFGFLNRWNSTLATDLESTPGKSLAAIVSN